MAVLSDSFCGRLGMTLPVVQAPVGSAATPELAAAVSGAGGLGTLALSWTSPDGCLRRIARTQALTSRPFGVNLVLEWPQQDRARACLETGVRVLSTSWGDPAPYAELAHRAGALHVHTVASAEEARRAADAGVDAVVAQGWEAGGHVAGTVSTLALVPAVLDVVGDLPVLAAGGISDGRGVAAVLALGAVAAWMGTRFLVTEEADVHPRYRARLLGAVETDPVHSRVFDGGWPDAPHRTLRNGTLGAWEAAGRPAPGSRPGEGQVVARTRTGREVLRYTSDLPTTAVADDGAEEMALYAGQGVALCSTTQPAAAVVAGIAEDARRRLAALGRR